MADPLIYAQNVYKPKMIVDIATLANGTKHGLGGAACGVFSNCTHLWKNMQKAGAITGDRAWRLPLWNYYKRLVTSKI